VHYASAFHQCDSGARIFETKATIARYYHVAWTDITLVGADRSYLPITRYGIVQSDGVTAISNYLKEATREIFQFDDITVIPNFVCQEDYQRHVDEALRKSLAAGQRTTIGSRLKFSAG